MKEFLINNRRTFTVERTSTGFPTLFYNNIQYYVRDKAMQRSFLNKILCFQNDVVVSQLYKFINKRSEEDIMQESKALEKSLMYKGFTFNPTKQNTIKGVIKIDLNTAYWQTCRIARCVKTSTYNDIVENCLKESRLKLTGSLGKKVLVTQYVEGVKTDFFIKKLPKKRIVFQNVYNRLRKYVDELTANLRIKAEKSNGLFFSSLTSWSFIISSLPRSSIFFKSQSYIDSTKFPPYFQLDSV
jgi:hypothetical protein